MGMTSRRKLGSDAWTVNGKLNDTKSASVTSKKRLIDMIGIDPGLLVVVTFQSAFPKMTNSKLTRTTSLHSPHFNPGSIRKVPLPVRWRISCPPA